MISKSLNIGIDLGSRTTKLVVFDPEKKEMILSEIRPTGINPQKSSQMLIEQTAKKLNLEPDFYDKIFTTGYGRNSISFSDKRISEISCHAQGVKFLFPKVKTIIDIGGQDSKVISLNDNGKVVDFAMNDKCAAGTGRFLEKVAILLESDIDQLSKLDEINGETTTISSTCVVFAESEIIGLIAQGASASSILHGVYKSIAKRLKNLISQVEMKEPVVFTGGVANNQAMVSFLSNELGVDLLVAEEPTITGALGAAIFASK